MSVAGRWAEKASVSLVFRQERGGKLGADLIRRLRDGWADRRVDSRPVRADFLHRGDGCAQYAADRAAPARMSRADNRAVLGREQHRGAIRRQDTDSDARDRRHHGIGMRRICRIPGPGNPFHILAMHLVHRVERRRPIEGGQRPAPVFRNVVRRIVRPETDVQGRVDRSTDAALAGKDPGCVEALNMFVSIFGAVASNLALTGITTGGVYLGGGIPPKILSKLKEDIFMEAFTNKGRFKTFLEQIPVKVILNDKAALIGAAYCASQLK